MKYAQKLFAAVFLVWFVLSPLLAKPVSAGTCRVKVEPGVAGYSNKFTITGSDLVAGEDYRVRIEHIWNVFQPWSRDQDLLDIKPTEAGKIEFTRAPGGDDTKPGRNRMYVRRINGDIHICEPFDYTIVSAADSPKFGCKAEIQPRQPGLSDTVTLDFSNLPSPTGNFNLKISGPGGTDPTRRGSTKTATGMQVTVGGFRATGVHTVVLSGELSGQGNQALCRASFRVGATTGSTEKAALDSSARTDAFSVIPCDASGEYAIQTAVGCIPLGDNNSFIAWFLKWALGFAGGIAFILMLTAGFQIMTASGNPDQVQGGKELLNAAISGLILIIFSVFLLRLIGVDILGIPGFGS